MSPTQRFLADAVLPVDEPGRILTPGAVDVVDGQITWVGATSEAPELNEVVEHRVGGLLMPGLVNVHCHSPMTLLRGIGEGLPLMRWLTEVMWPREAKLDADDVGWGMRLAAAELLTYGVTTTCEMYLWPDAVAQAASEAGLRSVVTPAVIDAPGWERFGSWEQQAYAAVEMASRYQGHPLIEVGIGLHSAYTVPVEGLELAAALAIENDLLLHIHVAESQNEDAGVREQHGVSVPQLLADRGVLDVKRVLAAHCVWMSDEDLDLFAANDVAVAHCPQSNAKIASGTARLADMISRGIRVGLGTDGPASNNNLNLWEELRLAPLMARLRDLDAQAISAPLALELATRRGADALGRQDIGSLQPGRQADMIRLDLDDLAFVPFTEAADLISHLVWSAGSRAVTDVWVGGAQVVANRACLTVDVAEARAQVNARASALAGGG